MENTYDSIKQADGKEHHIKMRLEEAEQAHKLANDDTSLPLEAEARALTDPRISSSANLGRKTQVLLGMQGAQGNMYVQRLMAGSASKLTPVSSDPSVGYGTSPSALPSRERLVVQRQEEAESASPSALGESSELHLDPEIAMRITAIELSQQLLDPSLTGSALRKLDLNLPQPTGPAEPTGAELLAGPSPKPESPLVPAGKGPEKPRPAKTEDAVKAVLAVPYVDEALKTLQMRAGEKVRRDYGKLSTGEKAAAISVTALIGGGALAGALSDPESRKFLLGQLNGRLIPVPGVNGLSVEFNTQRDNLMIGLHLDVGALLPASLGFGPAKKMTPIGGPPSSVKRQVAEEEEANNESRQDHAYEVNPDVAARIERERGSGQALESGTREEMEATFGREFGDVRIHTGAEADHLAREVHAEAFTTGSDVFFREGNYAPASPDGRQLLVHELTHVTQQSDGQATLQRQVSTEPEAGAEQATGKKPEITWEEAYQVLDAITDIINKFVEEDEQGMIHRVDRPEAHKDVPGRWQPLLREWWMITVGTVVYPNGMQVSYPGDFLAAHIDMAVDQTEPLVKALLAEGDSKTAPFLAKYYYSKVKEFRARAVSEAVQEAIKKGAEKEAGGELDVGALADIEMLKIGSSQALSTVAALMTVTQRAGGANVAQAKEIEKLFTEVMGKQEVPASVRAGVTKATDLANALNYLQGGLRFVQTIAAISDPEKRLKAYQEQGRRFGLVAEGTEILKDLTQFVSGTAAVLGAGTYAVATVLGKAELAAKALSVGGKALGNINVALNAFGVIHGIAVLVDSQSTTLEKIEAGVEVSSGTLGLLGRFVPALSASAAAASASLLITFYSFKGIATEAMEGFEGLIALGLNICYDYMSKQANYISKQAMQYAAALDLASTITDPAKSAELAKLTEAERWNLVDFFIKEFMESATESEGRGNKDPGTYEILRRRFLPLKGAKLETPDQIIAFTKNLLNVIVKCFSDAKEIYTQQVEYSWTHRGY